MFLSPYDWNTFRGTLFLIILFMSHYRKDTEPLYHSFMYNLVSIISSIYPLPAMDSLLVTILILDSSITKFKREINSWALTILLLYILRSASTYIPCGSINVTGFFLSVKFATSLTCFACRGITADFENISFLGRSVDSSKDPISDESSGQL